MLIQFPVPLALLRSRRGGAAAEAAAVTSVTDFGASAAATEADKEKEGRDVTTTPIGSIAQEGNVIDLAQLVYDAAVAAQRSYERQENARVVASRIHRGEYDLHPVRLGGAMGLAIANVGRCALECNREWSEGPAMGFWTRYGGYCVVHLACYRYAVTNGQPPTPVGQPSGGAA